VRFGLSDMLDVVGLVLEVAGLELPEVCELLGGFGTLGVDGVLERRRCSRASSSRRNQRGGMMVVG